MTLKEKEEQEKKAIRSLAKLVKSLPKPLNPLPEKFWLYFKSRYLLTEEFWKEIFKELKIKKQPSLLYPEFRQN